MYFFLKKVDDEKLLQFEGFNMSINPKAEEAWQGSSNPVLNVIIVHFSSWQTTQELIKLHCFANKKNAHSWHAHFEQIN